MLALFQLLALFNLGQAATDSSDIWIQNWHRGCNLTRSPRPNGMTGWLDVGNETENSTLLDCSGPGSSGNYDCGLNNVGEWTSPNVSACTSSFKASWQPEKMARCKACASFWLRDKFNFDGLSGACKTQRIHVLKKGSSVRWHWKRPVDSGKAENSKDAPCRVNKWQANGNDRDRPAGLWGVGLWKMDSKPEYSGGLWQCASTLTASRNVSGMSPFSNDLKKFTLLTNFFQANATTKGWITWTPTELGLTYWTQRIAFQRDYNQSSNPNPSPVQLYCPLGSWVAIHVVEDCNQPLVIDCASITSSCQLPVDHGAECSVQCDDGYTLYPHPRFNSSSAICYEGQWYKPTCSANLCYYSSTPVQAVNVLLSAALSNADLVKVANNCSAVPSGASCSLFCNTGYSASGDIQCVVSAVQQPGAALPTDGQSLQAAAVWSSTLPTCQPNPCNSVDGITSLIPKATMSHCVGTPHGQFCVLKCLNDTGARQSWSPSKWNGNAFILDNTASVQCQAGLWLLNPSNLSISCQPSNCQMKPKMKRQTVSNTYEVIDLDECQGKAHNSEFPCMPSCTLGDLRPVSFNCSFGYYPLGSDGIISAICANSATKSCVQAPSVPNGVAPCNIWEANSFCSVTCNTGYQLVPTSIVGVPEQVIQACNLGKAWCQPDQSESGWMCVPTCLAGTCGATLPDGLPANGCTFNNAIQLPPYPSGTICPFPASSCSSVQTLSGTTSICQAGNWSVPVCLDPIPCSLTSPVLAPSSYATQVSWGNCTLLDQYGTEVVPIFPRTCTPACNSGYKLQIGSQTTLSCLKTGVWSGQVTCVPLTCDSAPAIANANATQLQTCIGKAANEVCELTGMCLSGYTMIPGIATCNGTNWTSSVCIGNPCPPLSITNGNGTQCGTSHLSLCACRENCSTSTTASGWSCNAGYIGNEAVATCSLGLWQNAPTCSPRNCTSSIAIIPLLKAATSFSHGTSALVFCQDNHIFCPGESGSSCRSGSETFLSAKCEFGQWKQDYSLQSSNTQLSLGECKKPCNTLPVYANSGNVASCPGTLHLGVCTIQCITKYWPAASGLQARCNNGAWTYPADPFKLCLAPCMGTPSVLNAVSGSCTITTSGQSCTPTCPTNYVADFGAFTCTNGTFSVPATTPACRPPCVGAPIPYSRSQLCRADGAQCPITCLDDTYVQGGTTTVTCSDQGSNISQFSVTPTNPTRFCYAPCTSAPNVPNSNIAGCAGKKHGEKCVWDCNTNYYKLDGVRNADLTCFNGTWSFSSTTIKLGSQTLCLAPCGIPSIANDNDAAMALCDQTMHGGTCNWACDTYYTRIQNSPNISCQSGSWVLNTSHFCTPPCAANPVIANSAGMSCANTVHNADCTVSCATNFTKSANTVRCVSGIWQLTNPTVECMAPCTSNPTVQEGASSFVMKCGIKKHSETCSFNCQNTIEYRPSAPFTCTKGLWNSQRCVQTGRCGSTQPTVTNAEADWKCPVNVETGENCTLSCANGYSPGATGVRYLCINGSWYPKYPNGANAAAHTCNPDPCPYLPANSIRFAKSFASCNNTAHGQSCSWQCLDYHVPAVTPDTASLAIPCNLGQFQIGGDYPVRTCLRPCTSKPNVTNSAANSHCINTLGNGSTCIWSCPSNWRQEGSSVAVCNNGTWDEDANRECLAPCTSAPNFIANSGNLNACIGTQDSSACLWQCLPNWLEQGPTTIKCTNGQWEESTAYQCIAPCDDIPLTGLGSLGKACKNTENGQECVWDCAVNWTQQGENVVSCGAKNGQSQWALKGTQMCVPPCVSAPAIANGAGIAACANTSIEGRCYWSCTGTWRPAYDLPGSTVSNFTTCKQGLSTSAWDLVGTQKCFQACSSQPTILYLNQTKSNCINTQHGKTCALFCLNDYILSGSTTLTCNEGQWQYTDQVCYAPCRSTILPVIEFISSVAAATTLHGTSVGWSCRLNHIQTGPATIQCSNGVWQVLPAMQCFPPCGPLPLPNFGGLSDTKCNQTLHLNNCTIFPLSASFVPGAYCTGGTRNNMDPPAQVQCINGVWQPTEAQCLKPCEADPTFDNRDPSQYNDQCKAVPTALSGSYHWTNLQGAKCAVKCQSPSYVPNGNAQMTCSAQGTWVSEYGAQVCVPAPCVTPLPILNAVSVLVNKCIQNGGTPSGSSCQGPFCAVGQKAFVGDVTAAVVSSVACNLSVWNLPANVKCLETPCQTAPTVGNAKISSLNACVGTRSQQNCTIQCLSEFYMAVVSKTDYTRLNNATCKSGVWVTQPTCVLDPEKVNCLDADPGGANYLGIRPCCGDDQACLIGSRTPAFFFEDKCTIPCKPGYQLVNKDTGNSEVVCNWGVWTRGRCSSLVECTSDEFKPDCVDMDECAIEGGNDCGGATCLNLPSGYICQSANETDETFVSQLINTGKLQCNRTNFRYYRLDTDCGCANILNNYDAIEDAIKDAASAGSDNNIYKDQVEVMKYVCTSNFLSFYLIFKNAVDSDKKAQDIADNVENTLDDPSASIRTVCNGDRAFGFIDLKKTDSCTTQLNAQIAKKEEDTSDTNMTDYYYLALVAVAGVVGFLIFRKWKAHRDQLKKEKVESAVEGHGAEDGQAKSTSAAQPASALQPGAAAGNASSQPSSPSLSSSTLETSPLISPVDASSSRTIIAQPKEVVVQMQRPVETPVSSITATQPQGRQSSNSQDSMLPEQPGATQEEDDGAYGGQQEDEDGGYGGQDEFAEDVAV